MHRRFPGYQLADVMLALHNVLHDQASCHCIIQDSSGLKSYSSYSKAIGVLITVTHVRGRDLEYAGVIWNTLTLPALLAMVQMTE